MTPTSDTHTESTVQRDAALLRIEVGRQATALLVAIIGNSSHDDRAMTIDNVMTAWTDLYHQLLIHVSGDCPIPK